MINPRPGDLIAIVGNTGVGYTADVVAADVHSEGWDVGGTLAADLPLEVAADPFDEDEILTAAEEAVERAGYEVSGDWYAADDQWSAIARRLDS